MKTKLATTGQPCRFFCLMGCALVASLWQLPAATAADVQASDEDGFIISIKVPIESSPEAVFEQLPKVGEWWSSQHTYSLDAKNMYLETKPKGWFGEKIGEEGFVKHMEVAFYHPESRTIRLCGGLGPLQELGISGTMTWKVTPHDEGALFEIRYAVHGYLPSGLAPLAEPVNGVLAEQAERLKDHCQKK